MCNGEKEKEVGKEDNDDDEFSRRMQIEFTYLIIAPDVRL